MTLTLAYKSLTLAYKCTPFEAFGVHFVIFHYPILSFFQPKSNFILLILYPYTSIKIISCKLNQFLVSNYLFNFYTHFTIFTTHLFTTNKNHTLILHYCYLISIHSIINCILFPIHHICFCIIHFFFLLEFFYSNFF